MEKKLDIDRVRTASHFSRQHLDEWIMRAELAYTDKNREQRQAAQLCRWCFYGRGSRVAGQAFTDRACEGCETVVTYPSTATNPLCRDCAFKYGLCLSCCADVDLANRTKVERHGKGAFRGGKAASHG